ncbi:Cell wall / vacuolar inhibitor of fructosidase 2 [Striga hermonthica]|uniref:Cell wall / vacuolar inhibitor of fructosidase 2 n=1 Tax=Striga hermonthica TaxID=68872 RepID=A0A9N7NAI9_STRHE|nr:Cell wall / vacuolar inhibitor of fructosidase 2 [Striga hermonthica]
MASSWRFLLMFLTILAIFSSLSSKPSTLIQQTCKNTKHYDLCVSSLKSDASSAKADTKGLALIMIRLGVANATATSAYLSSAKNETALVMKECADKYALAGEALRSSVQDLLDDSYDYAYIHVMAAADYPNSCRNGFRRYPGLVYPPELAVREDGLKGICDVVLGIIDSIGFQ